MPLAGSAGYLATIYMLNSHMRSRPEVKVSKPVLLLYNATQVVINLYVAIAIAAPLGGRVWGMGMRDNADVRYGVFLHYLCKYLDMIDTIIIVLRKKSAQLSFLHLWHHSTIVVVWGWVVNTWPTAEQKGSAVYAYGAWINSCVHVIMYAYYGLTAVGIRPPFKKAVTAVQLTQFFSCIVVALLALLVDETPILYNGVQVCYHLIMMRLFLPLLLGLEKNASAPACPPWRSMPVVQATPPTKQE
eukprot:CAMPEP_0119356532 /NCGR_PEP_ID=MMETSP1334-20130426/5109_1 /TAXON_ID=127549 /ORGANISM="Calcidiscus leptoporus, Strain RCC1130" /LENGTH=243 /DNA_ID=CAMNT_0007370591 /DNA_START=140 /DNA_END=871 /DNA_ORIENTATION=+